MKKRNVYLKYGAGTTALVGVPAFAAVPPEVEALFTSLGADATTLSGYSIGLMTIVIGLLTVIGLARKFVTKAT